MRTLDEIVKLQKRLRKLSQKYDGAEEEIDEIAYDYGDLDAIEARLRDAEDSLSEVIRIGAEEHGQFDSRHSVTAQGKSTRFRTVSGCPDCDSLLEAHGLADLIEESKNLRWARSRLKKLEDRRDDMAYEFNDLVAQINELGQALGLPSFEVRWDENHGLVGFITKVGSVNNFKIHERVILQEGHFVNYDLDGRTARAIFDSAEQLVAYHLGDRNWTITATWEKYKASINWDSGTAQTNLFVGTIGETDQKKKVHIAIDEHGDVVFVRDMDGEVLYDRKQSKGSLPPDLNWSR